ncbi:MAG: AsmA family protein [Planctomycetales bacterium]|nr:AsmA family protein [Planctomycetales bacterium]
MKKVKKILVRAGIILLVLIAAVAILIKLYGNQAVKIGIEKASRFALKVDTRLGGVNLFILGGTLDLNNLEIDNPEGYEHPTFLNLGHGHVDLATTSLLSETIEIEKMQFDNITLTIEQKGMSNNLKEILNNLPKPKPDQEPAPEPAKEEKPGKKLLIKQLDINGIEVKVKLLPVPGRADTLTLRINPIHMENLGSNEKIDLPALISKILTAIAGGIAEQGKDLLPTDMINSIGDQLSEQRQKILESGKEAGSGLLQGVEDVGKSATDAIKGLLPGKKED